IVLDGTTVIDAGVITGATSITSTAFVGDVTGNADTVTTNANLTGVITSSGNTTSINSQTGTGSQFVVSQSPTIVTPTIASMTNAQHDHSNAANGGTFGTPSFSVYMNAAQTGIATSTFTKILFDTELFDTDGLFASYQVTPTEGKWMFLARAGIIDVAGGKRVRIALYKNNTTAVAEGSRPYTADSSTASIGSVGTWLIDCDGVDTYQIYIEHTSGTNKALNYGASTSFFMGYRIAD
ncbi:MAG: hypothetical protein GY941_16575, partial [Planctomycetes bacterium]|nr:hypothetical protein [Planctomycetota bacterium]